MRAFAYRATERGIARRAAERRQAILAAPGAPEQVEAPVAAPVAEAEPEKSNVIPFCAAKAELRKLRDRGMPDWAKAMVVQVAIEHDIPVDIVMGLTRSKSVVVARNEVFYRLRTTASPVNRLHPSFPQISGWFGREESAALYGASKHAYDNGLPPVSTTDIGRRMARAVERERNRRRGQ